MADGMYNSPDAAAILVSSVTFCLFYIIVISVRTLNHRSFITGMFRHYNWAHSFADYRILEVTWLSGGGCTPSLLCCHGDSLGSRAVVCALFCCRSSEGCWMSCCCCMALKGGNMMNIPLLYESTRIERDGTFDRII